MRISKRHRNTKDVDNKSNKLFSKTLASVLALVTALSPISFHSDTVFLANTSDIAHHETYFMPTHFISDSGSILVTSHLPQSQQSLIGNSVNLINLDVSLAFDPHDILLTHWQLVHDTSNHVVNSGSFDSIRVPQTSQPDIDSDVEVDVPPVDIEYPTTDIDTNVDGGADLDSGHSDNEITSDNEAEDYPDLEDGEYNEDVSYEPNFLYSDTYIENAIIDRYSINLNESITEGRGYETSNFPELNDSYIEDIEEVYNYVNTSLPHNITYNIDNVQLEDAGYYSLIIFYTVNGSEFYFKVGPFILELEWDNELSSSIGIELVNFSSPYAIRYVSAGGNTSMAIRNDGTLWGWGSNDRRLLGFWAANDHHNRPVHTNLKTNHPEYVILDI